MSLKPEPQIHSFASVPLLLTCTGYSILNFHYFLPQNCSFYDHLFFLGGGYGRLMMATHYLTALPLREFPSLRIWASLRALPDQEAGAEVTPSQDRRPSLRGLEASIGCPGALGYLPYWSPARTMERPHRKVLSLQAEGKEPE